MSADGVTDKQWMELLAKVDNLVEGVNSLRTDLKDWKDELIEEFSELTGNLMEYYQQVIDKHLLNKEVEDYFGDGNTIDSPSSGEDSDSDSTFVDEEGDNHSNDNKSKQSDQSVTSDGDKHLSGDQTIELESEVD